MSRQLAAYAYLFFFAFFLPLSFDFSGAYGNENSSDEKMEEEMQAQRKKYQEISNQLGAENFTDNLNLEKIKKALGNLGKKDGQKSKGNLLNGGTRAKISTMLIPFQSIPEDTIKKNLITNLKEGWVKGFLEKSPRVQSFLAKLLKSKEALPDLASILDDKKRLYTFAIVNIIFFIILKIRKMISNRRKNNYRDPSGSFLAGLVTWFLGFFLVQALRIGIFIFFFHKEAGPTWKIFRQVMLPL